MKKSIFIICFTFFIASSFAQNTIAATKIEQAVLTKNFLFKQEVFSVDNIAAFRMDAIKITNLENFSITNGLKVIQKVQVGKELKTFYNYIDADEIDGLLTTFQYMNTILKSKTVPSSYTEIKYTTKSGFQIMLFTVLNLRNKLDWSFVAHTNIDNEKTLTLLQNEDIDKIQKTLEQAKSKF